MHLVAWDKMTQPKLQGGAGLRSLKQANLAMLAKSGWRLLKEKDSLWTQLMVAKYGRQRENLDIIRPIQGSSFTWRSFTKAADLLRKGCAWNIKNGKRTKFWLDPWVLQVPLKEVALGHIPESDTAEPIERFVEEDGTWQTELFEDLIPSDVFQKILSIGVDKMATEDDTIFWSASSDGRFSAKTAYSLQNQGTPDPDEDVWKIIWSLPVPERIRSFLWLAFLGRLASNSHLFSRKVTNNQSCGSCGHPVESILHILRDCTAARYFWLRHSPPGLQASFFYMDESDWLRGNLRNSEPLGSGMSWAAFFSVASWLLWKNRCTSSFRGSSSALSPPSLEYSIMAKCKLWHEAWQAPSPLPYGRGSMTARTTVMVGWTPPIHGWVALNVDGASNGNPGAAGAGGVLRDGTGNWIAGFLANFGTATAILAELWAVFHGLDMAWKKGYRAVRLESDSQLAIQLINNRSDPVHPHATLLSAIRRKIGQDWLVSITHVYREGNRVADWLSKHSLVYPYGVHEVANPPPELASIVREDAMGISFERRIVAMDSTSL
ncbi:unnamed protein product [Linum trigynum]|uniref:RNase H type-1 domain-containing protein n=1 Tax=Linum trigynum TaxID=586398 RepID=A0AAV2FFG5_9ROSI